MKLSVIVPTFNEAPNIEELVRGITAACHNLDAEILFVDDSTDDTPQVIERAALQTPMPVRLIHRAAAVGGLSGAVIEGMKASAATYALVMDGDLQHPPEMIPVLLARLEQPGTDVVVASRYCGQGGSSAGLAGGYRRFVSVGATLLTRTLFPVRLRSCSDPMTGFFAVRRAAVNLSVLQPSGFKILLEILARQPLVVAEVPFIFAKRFAGESKAGMSEGFRFLRQVGELRVGRVGLFAAVGAAGTVLNLLIMATLLGLGTHYVFAAVVAAELTIVSNFLLQERLVFSGVRSSASRVRTRFLQSFSFNNLEAALRLPLLILLVEVLAFHSVLAQAGTIAAAFTLRYLYHSKVVYLPRTLPTGALLPSAAILPTLSTPAVLPQLPDAGTTRLEPEAGQV